jgi:hypothetical protein
VAHTIIGMVTTVCWNCGVMAHMTAVSTPTYTHQFEDFQYVVHGTYSCDNCQYWSLARVDGEADPGEPISAGEIIATANDVVWSPPRGVGKDYADVPSPVASAASEAHQCRSIGAHRGAIVLARAVIEATAKAKGIASGDLYHKIDAMRTAGHIREHVKEAAHEARYLGNDMAHGDFGADVDGESTDDVLTIMDEVLLEVFQSPARTEKLRQRRSAANATASTAPANPSQPST